MAEVSTAAADQKQVVLVTGASGCLGQHLVKHLQERDESVKEIKCLDIKPYQNNLQHKTEKPMTIITADIRNERAVVKALEGVDCVIHCAAVVDTGLWPDVKTMNSVNVDGTQILMDAMVELNVKYLVFVSGADVIVGDDPIYYGAENTTPVPKRHILAHSKTKLDAEVLVKEANGRQLSNGKDSLHTIIMRPSLIYGEQDQHFITAVLKLTKQQSGVLRQLDNVFVRIQPTYAGNAAWACLRAKDKLREDKSVAGEEFFVTDDTQILDPFEFLAPYVQSRGYKLSVRAYPYWLFMLVMYFVVLAVRLLWSVYPIELPKGLTQPTLRYLCNTYFYNRTKATLRLDYEPIYGYEESQQKSLQYYKRLFL
ncbi:3 beta-hydroxysteroid dehydrogenase/Delta 5--_4-isomerase-like [Oppia nitens]|uniref:3 beta-hydroxysteroid dehydrogenase/Delta 5-->4-isomerase-like n=1 Tax=Oppia nitens TaxID=1686743 RepID=UPI0023DA75D2|nr:3 beta-hydroxysteroid dehydrogenase/Delta 5-->4-isomerase-like [Oppia nitens]